MLKHWRAIAFIVGLSVLLSAPWLELRAQTGGGDLAGGQSGKIQYAGILSRSYTELSKGKYEPSSLVGVLTLPKVATAEKLSAVIIMHGSGGVGDREQDWSELFLAQGWATFIVDSFTPRGIKSSVNDQGQLPYPTSVADAFSSLKVLATHPKIDASKIAVIGFSRGGLAALYSSIDHFRLPITGSALKFAAHIAMYPGCSLYSERQSGAPIRIFIGDQDSWEQPEKCKRYTDRLKAKGIDADTIVYQNAKHDFDTSSYSPIVMPRAETWKSCMHITNFDTGTYTRYDTGETGTIGESVAYAQTCKSLGAIAGGDKRAREAVRKASVEFFTTAFAKAN